MSGWMLAKGMSAQGVLAAPAAAGARRLEIEGADGLFAPGDPLFMAEADGTEAEYLGGIAGVDSAGIDAALPLRRSKSEGAAVWKAAAFMAAGVEGVPLRREIEGGAAIERSLAGTVYAVEASAALEKASLTLEGLTPALAGRMETWLAAHAGRGLHPFTLVSPAGEVLAVRFGSPGWRVKEGPGAAWAAAMELWIEGRGNYA